jgi:alpha-galactosidase
LRTIPELQKIAFTMEEVCPDGLFINYSNPMAMNMWALYESSYIQSVGLCHSVQGTSEELANYMKIPYEELRYRVAGINHMAWFLELNHKGKDVYPLLEQAMNDPDVYKKNKVRFEIMRYFGYFVTESSEHMAEYTPFFIQHNDLITQLDIPIREYVRRCEGILDEYEANKKLGLSDETLEIKRSREYGSWIIHGIETGTRHCIHGNVENTGLITSLPQGCCVEVPCMVDQTGINPTFVGELPPQLNALNLSNINVQELVVRALLEEERDYVYHAAYMDPHTQSVLPLAKIRAMVDDLFEAHKDVLPF